MKRLHKFLHLTFTDQILLLKAVFTVVAIRLGLWILPFRVLRRLLTRVMHKPAELRQANCPSVDRIAWAVTVTSRYVPAATCLTRAFATQMLLDRCRYPSRLHIGVERGKGGQLQAHAWIESDGVIVIGGSESQLERYTPLPTFQGKGV